MSTVAKLSRNAVSCWSTNAAALLPGRTSYVAGKSMPSSVVPGLYPCNLNSGGSSRAALTYPCAEIPATRPATSVAVWRRVVPSGIATLMVGGLTPWTSIATSRA